MNTVSSTIDYSRLLDEESYVSQVTDNISDFLDTYNQNKTLSPASDVSVNAVITSFYFNSVIFIFIMLTYEFLRRKFPAIYNGRRNHVNPDRLIPSNYDYNENHIIWYKNWFPFWMLAVIRVPWKNILECCGLDAYMFLRYIRMCLRITFVTGIWGMIFMWPIFARGEGEAQGWYHFSMANLNQGAKELWVPTIFLWLFSFYVFYVMKNEYNHFLDLRMKFLGNGDPSVHPQHDYSLLVEQIPKQLRSDSALFDYFDSLFPGKVHSASIVLKLPALEKLSTRRKRVIQRLEKSVAYYEATKKRPSHRVGRPRLMCLGIQTEPFDYCNYCMSQELYEGTDPPRGVKVDSIKYYSNELKAMNKKLIALQVKHTNIAGTGNQSIKATDWMSKILRKQNSRSFADEDYQSAHGSSSSVPPTQLSESASIQDSKKKNRKDNEKQVSYGTIASSVPVTNENEKSVPLLNENGEKNNSILESKKPPNKRKIFNFDKDNQKLMVQNEQILTFEEREGSIGFNATEKPDFPDFDYSLFDLDENNQNIDFVESNLGVDFVKNSFKFIHDHIVDTYMDEVLGNTMSSTGFVTFKDQITSTCVSTAQLTEDPYVLKLSRAPEPRDIEWANAHIDKKTTENRQWVASLLLGLGAILWSIPLTIIQAFATAESLAMIPGMSWLLSWNGGYFKTFINGYLPVVALLILIMLLPIIFEYIALKYERLKTYSGVQHAILTRYFYYQLANIYISVTAGSLWNSLADILDHPTNALQILGVSLPTLVGYFVSLLLTKVLAGLPILLLRGGALFRMLFLRSFFTEKFLTQRELDEVYRPQFLLFGWEYPTQLLVIVICFTYACISPVILPFGAGYFGFAYIIYKQQVMYVYTPRYESGGESFPLAMQRTLVGLICAQITFIGYVIIRRGRYEPIATFPLLLITVQMMGDFRRRFVEPSQNLSLERIKLMVEKSTPRRAVTDLDIFESSDVKIDVTSTFNAHAYRQPIRTEGVGVPIPYRHGQVDEFEEEINDILNLDTVKRTKEWTSRSEELRSRSSIV